MALIDWAVEASRRCHWSQFPAGADRQGGRAPRRGLLRTPATGRHRYLATRTSSGSVADPLVEGETSSSPGAVATAWASLAYSFLPRPESISSEAITLTCAARGVPLQGLEASAHVDVDPGPITGAKEPADWDNTMKSVRVDVTVKGDLSAQDRAVVEDGAKRSPVHYMFSKTGLLKTEFHYGK